MMCQYLTLPHFKKTNKKMELSFEGQLWNKLQFKQQRNGNIISLWFK